MSVEKLVVDTDCGVDDALALLLALSSSRCEVVAITCCFGNTILDNACQNVKRVLNLVKATQVPVYKGSAGPLLSIERKKDTAYHAQDGLGNCAHMFDTGDLVESDVSGVTALLQLTRDRPGEITLLALGPLTNLAMAHRMDPGFTQRLKQIVCMGGNYKGMGNTTELSEFNFYCDPEAADIVLGESLCPITLVPWETCLEFGFNSSTYERLLQVGTPKGIFYREVTKLMVARSKAKGRSLCTDCDFMAVVAALYPEGVTSTLERPLAVECGGKYSRGLVVLLNPEKTPDALNRNKIQIVSGFDVLLVDELRYKMLQEERISL